MAPQGTAKVKAKTLPPPHKRPKLGITVPSSIVRDNELARQAGAQLGECEGYRQGEIVWVTLRPPIIDPAQSTRKIDKWPAQIEDVTFGVDVTPSTEGGKVNLAKRVKQDRRYSIVLIGVPQERAKVTESRLMPYLCTFIDHDVANGSFGNASDHAWLQSESGFPDNLTLLEGGKSDVTPSEWATRLSALAFSLTVCNYLRCRYRLTDPFVVPPAPAKGQTTQLERWPHATKYWQGMYAGLERVWVGDIVRLRLTQQEAHAMLRSLRKEDKLTDEANALWDTKSPYALRLKAIYDERESEGEDEADGVEGSSGLKIAGILYRVQVGGKVSSGGGAEDTDVVSGDATGSSDAQAGSKPLAAPKSDLLSTWGETVSRVKMPEGLSLQAVTSKGKEAIMEPVQIAGRLYPSLLRSLKGSLEAAVQGKAADLEAANAASSEDFEDIDAARLAVSGALPGPVRAMCLDDQTTESAEAYLRACLDAGRTDTADLVRAELVKTPAAAAAAEAPVTTASTSGSNATSSIFDPAIEEAAIKAAEAVESGTIQENVAEDSGEKTSSTVPVTRPNGNDGIAGVPSHENGKSAVPTESEPEPIPTDAQRQEQAGTKPSVATAGNKPSSPPTRAASPPKVSSPPRDPRLARRRRGIDANANGVPSMAETNGSASPSTGTKRKAGSPVDIAASNQAVADKDGGADELVSQHRNNKAAKVADSSSSDLHSSQLATPVKPTSPAPTIAASSPTSTPGPSGQAGLKSAETSAKDATGERQASPPLPPGWIKRTSRQGHGVYYANKNTRETRWDRPTA